MALRMIKRGFSSTNEGWTSRGRISSQKRGEKKETSKEVKSESRAGSLNKLDV